MWSLWLKAFEKCALVELEISLVHNSERQNPGLPKLYFGALSAKLKINDALLIFQV